MGGGCGVSERRGRFEGLGVRLVGMGSKVHGTLWQQKGVYLDENQRKVVILYAQPDAE